MGRDSECVDLGHPLLFHLTNIKGGFICVCITTRKWKCCDWQSLRVVWMMGCILSVAREEPSARSGWARESTRRDLATCTNPVLPGGAPGRGPHAVCRCRLQCWIRPAIKQYSFLPVLPLHSPVPVFEGCFCLEGGRMGCWFGEILDWRKRTLSNSRRVVLGKS